MCSTDGHTRHENMHDLRVHVPSGQAPPRARAQTGDDSDTGWQGEGEGEGESGYTRGRCPTLGHAALLCPSGTPTGRLLELTASPCRGRRRHPPAFGLEALQLSLSKRDQRHLTARKGRVDHHQYQHQYDLDPNPLIGSSTSAHGRGQRPPVWHPSPSSWPRRAAHTTDPDSGRAHALRATPGQHRHRRHGGHRRAASLRATGSVTAPGTGLAVRCP